MAQRQVAISRFLVAVITGQLAGSSLAGHPGGLASAGAACSRLSAGMMALAVRRDRDRLPQTRRAGGALRSADGARALPARSSPIRAPGCSSASCSSRRSRSSASSPTSRRLLEERGQGGATRGRPRARRLRDRRARLLRARALDACARSACGGCWSSAGSFAAVALRRPRARRQPGSSMPLAMVVLGLGFYMLHNSFQTQVTEIAPTARASAVALHAFSFFVGQALGRRRFRDRPAPCRRFSHDGRARPSLILRRRHRGRRRSA